MTSVRNQPQDTTQHFLKNSSLQLDPKAWNFTGNPEYQKKEVECIVPICFRDKAASTNTPVTFLAPEKITAIVDGVEQRGNGYKLILILYLQDETQLKRWETENANLLERIHACSGNIQLYTAQQWQETERRKQAEKAFESFFATETGKDLKEQALEADVRSNSKAGYKGDPQNIRSHCIDCAIDYVSFSYPQGESHPKSVMFYDQSFSQIMHHTSKNMANMGYEELLRIKPAYKEKPAPAAGVQSYEEAANAVFYDFAQSELMNAEDLSIMVYDTYIDKVSLTNYFNDVVLPMMKDLAKLQVNPVYLSAFMRATYFLVNNPVSVAELSSVRDQLSCAREQRKTQHFHHNNMHGMFAAPPRLVAVGGSDIDPASRHGYGNGKH